MWMPLDMHSASVVLHTSKKETIYLLTSTAEESMRQLLDICCWYGCFFSKAPWCMKTLRVALPVGSCLQSSHVYIRDMIYERIWSGSQVPSSKLQHNLRCLWAVRTSTDTVNSFHRGMSSHRDLSKTVALCDRWHAYQHVCLCSPPCSWSDLNGEDVDAAADGGMRHHT